MMSGKTVSIYHRIGNTDCRCFFTDGKMQHTARGLLTDKQFSNSFFKRSDPPHPAVNIETLLFCGYHVCGFFVLVLVLDSQLCSTAPYVCAVSKICPRSFIVDGRNTRPFEDEDDDEYEDDYSVGQHGVGRQRTP
jgi:hypothetical protein